MLDTGLASGFGTGSTACSEPITVVQDALIMPTGGLGRFTVVDRAGAPVVDAVTFRKAEVNFCQFVDRQKVTAPRRLQGRYLFAGDFWAHFGHFVFESLSRLWAIDHVAERLDGIIFLVRREGSEWTAGSLHSRIFDLLGIDIPVIIVCGATSVDELVVPRQGLGMGAMAAGTPSMRRFFRERFSKVQPKQGVERLYISRQNYRLNRGGLLGENILQRNLVQQGYTAYSPERAPIEDQIATYLGAEQIVSLDSSALHLFGFVARPEQDLSIILRRHDGAVDLLPQITGFSGRVPQVIDRITMKWVVERQSNPNWRCLCEADFDAIGADLLSRGMIDTLQGWRSPPEKHWMRIRETAEAGLRSRLLPDPSSAAA